MNELLRGFLAGLSVGRSLKGWSSCPAEPVETDSASVYREIAALDFSDNGGAWPIHERESMEVPMVQKAESVEIAYA